MGPAESKDNHRHRHRSSKHVRGKNESSRDHPCHQHKRKESETLLVGKKKSVERKNETIVPLITSSPLNPSLQGSILHHSFPMQRSHSEIQIIPYDQSHNGRIESLERVEYGSYEHPKGAYDYRKHMQRVDEENRPVLEGLCPDKMYVSTNDLRICEAQRLPPPLRYKTSQGFFRSIPSTQVYQKKTIPNTAFL